MSSTPNVIWDDQPHPASTPHPAVATSPQVQWDDEVSTPHTPRTDTPQQPVKPAPVQVTQPSPAIPPAIAEQVRTALPNIAQYPENQQKPDPDYVQRKAAFEAVQGEPGAPQDFEYDAEQERRIKAQEQVDSAHSMIPQAAVPALAAAKKYAVDPFEKASQAGAQVGRDLAARALVTPPVEIPMQDNLPPVTEQEVQERLKDVPAPVVGTARAAGSVVGGVVADPRMWPLFFMGPEASAAKTAMSAGFATQMAAGAYEQAGELGKIMDNPDVPQEDKWEAGANMVLSTLMAAQAGGHPAMEAVKARLKEFQNLPPADQEQIRNILREKAPEIATEVDKSAGTQPTENAAPKVTWDDQKTAAKPERFRLPRGTSAAEVQGEVKGPNIRTVQVGDKTYAFDQRKINADGVTSAVERNELWRLTGGKAPEAAKAQAEQDVRGEESQPATEQPVKEQAAPEVKWDDEAAKPELQKPAQNIPENIPEKIQSQEHETTQVTGDTSHSTTENEGDKQQIISPERRTNVAERKRVAEMSPDERSHELLTSPKTGLPNDRAFEEDAHALGESHPNVGYADLDDFKRYNDALGHEGVDKAVLPAIGDLFRDAAAKEPGGSVKVYHRSGDEFNFRSTTPEAIKRVTDRVNKELAETDFRYQTKDGRILEKKGTGLSHGIGTDHESAEENSHADKQRRKELGLREGGRDLPAVDTRGAAGEQTAVRENTERERVPGKSAEEVKPSQTISGHLNGRRSSKIGTLTLPDKTVLELSVRPDPSQMGVYSLAASNGKNSTSYRMQYKGRDTLADVKKSFEEYLNIDSPGHEVTIGAPKQPHEMTLPEFAKNQGKPAENRYVQQQHEAVKKKAAPSRAKLSADKLSDFQVGRDKVVREGDRTYVVDRSGSHARTEVLSDAITPEFKANADKLNPEQRQRMIETVKTTPYLSDEGRKERLEVLQGEPEPGSQEYETLRQKLAAAESKGRQSSTQPTIGPGMQRVVDRLRTVADGLDKQIEDKQRSMTSNPTPKRMREYRSRLHDGDNLKRVQQAMRALADAHEQGNVPKGLENLRTKDEIHRLVYKGTENGGYYDVIPSHDYANKTPQGKALQELMERHKNEPSEAKEAREKASKISQLEADVQFQKLPGYFPTPKPVVEKMLDAADIHPGDNVLEPSAGKGNIADLIKERQPEAKLSTIEPQSKLRQILELKGHELADSDFLGHKGEYDKIVMNPPFENGQDIDHVQHAFTLLNPGGKLVAIMSESPFFRSDRKGQAFREWLEEHNGTSEKLEPGSFKESGTGVNARMVEIEKPKAKAAAAIPSTKQPWQMMRDEYISMRREQQDKLARGMGKSLSKVARYDRNPDVRSQISDAHANDVRTAVLSGKPVPAEVLKDYPDLKPTREPISTAKQEAEATQEPWQMTRKEWEASPQFKSDEDGKFPPHEDIVLDALERGDAVPPTVREEYGYERIGDKWYGKNAAENIRREQTPATAQFDEAVKQTGAEVKEGKPSPEFAAKIADATHLEPANHAALKEKFTGAAYQREYFKAALEPALGAWKSHLSEADFQNGIKSSDSGVTQKATGTDKNGRTSYAPNLPTDQNTDQVYIKVPGDGHFLVNNTPYAINKALKGANSGFAKFTPKDPAKIARPPSLKPTEADKQRYISRMVDEISNASTPEEKQAARDTLENIQGFKPPQGAPKPGDIVEFNGERHIVLSGGKDWTKEAELVPEKSPLGKDVIAWDKDGRPKDDPRMTKARVEGEAQSASWYVLNKVGELGNAEASQIKGALSERGSATPSAMPIPALISSVAGVIKKGSNLYHGAVDKALDWAHMGQTRPEIRKFDPDAADLATKMDAGGQYHKDIAEKIGTKVTGPLTEAFDKTDNFASRQKKNEISRDRMKGFHFLADAQNREWLEENHPEDFHRWNADPKIKEALDAYKPFESQLRDAVKQLGGKTIDEDYIKRIMDFATSGVAYEKGLTQGVEGPVELRQGAAAGAGGGRDNVVSPQIDRSKARKDAGKFYWDHGVFDFGPSFEKRWVEVQSKLDEHRLAVHSMSMGTRVMPDEAMPEKVFYNGQEFYRPDIAKEIREVQKRGVSAESKALADALGVSELPTPKDVREYANYEPLRRGSRFETAARNLAANVLAGKEGLEGKAANVNRMANLRYALPKEIVDALNDAGREKELGAASKLAQKVLGPLTQFIRQQIVGLAYGVPHMANILRKVVQATPGAALNPVAWANAFKVAFSKELKARGISGTEDPTYNMLLRNAAVSEGAVPEYKRYIEGNMDAENWAQTIGNAFRKGGKEGAKVTPLSATAGLGRLAIEPLNRFSEAGHRNLFKPGGIDQRARLWLGDFLKDRYPGMNEQRIAHEVNQTLGRYNRASWTGVQRNLGPLMLFPGWDYSSMAFALKHPFKTAAAPAVLMLLANAAVHSIGGNKNDEKNDLERVHIGKYSVRTNLFNDNMGSHMWGWALRGAKAGLDHKNAKEATGEVVKGIPGDVAGVTTGTMNPILSTPIQVGENRLRPGGGAEIAPRGDFKKKGHILPNKAAEDYADFGARRLFPIYDRATQAGQRPSLASFAGLAGVSVSEKKKKK